MQSNRHAGFIPVICVIVIALFVQSTWATSEIGDHTTTVKPEIVTRVTMSSVDTNRIVSVGAAIKDVVYSEEKGVTVKVDGKNAFIKYFAVEDPVTQERSYAETPTEFYIICADNSVYTMIAVPRKVPAQTIYLESQKDQIKENLEVFSGVPFEQKVISLIKSVYQDNIPYRYDLKKVKDGRKHVVDEKYCVNPTRNVGVPGEGITLTEYHVTLCNGSGQKEVSEKDFLNPVLVKKPVAIALDRHVVSHNQVTRLFVVETVAGGE